MIILLNFQIKYFNLTFSQTGIPDDLFYGHYISDWGLPSFEMEVWMKKFDDIIADNYKSKSAENQVKRTKNLEFQFLLNFHIEVIKSNVKKKILKNNKKIITFN